MNAPDTLENQYDYTEFDGKPAEWWQSYARKRKRIEPKIDEPDKPALAAVIPEPSLQKHVARIATSQAEGRTTVLTTTGVVIQFQQQQPAVSPGQAPKPGAVHVSRNFDAASVAIVMAHYERKGLNFTADQLPFSRGCSAEFKDRFRTLWTEVKEQRQTAPAPTTAKQITGRPKGTVTRQLAMT